MVEYGADLHTMDHGSGFPTLGSKHLRQIIPFNPIVKHCFLVKQF